MSNNNPRNQNMLGDLPLITAQHFLDLGNEYWKERGFCAYNVRYGVPADLERLQRLLHQKGQEKDVSYDSDEEEEAKRINSIILETKRKFRSWTEDNKIPYHEDILPRWEGTFCFCSLFVWLIERFT